MPSFHKVTIYSSKSYENVHSKPLLYEIWFLIRQEPVRDQKAVARTQHEMQREDSKKPINMASLM